MFAIEMIKKLKSVLKSSKLTNVNRRWLFMHFTTKFPILVVYYLFWVYSFIWELGITTLITTHGLKL